MVIPAQTCVIKASGANKDRDGCEKADPTDLCIGCHFEYTSYNAGTSPSTDYFCFLESEIGTLFNCDYFDTSSGECTLCKKGFVIDSSDATTCKARTTETCAQESIEGFCLECNDANHFPFHFSIDGAVDNPYYTYECVDQGSNEFDNYTLNVVKYTYGGAATQIEQYLLGQNFYVVYTAKDKYFTDSGKDYIAKCLKVNTSPFEN